MSYRKLAAATAMFSSLGALLLHDYVNADEPVRCMAGHEQCKKFTSLIAAPPFDGEKDPVLYWGFNRKNARDLPLRYDLSQPSLTFSLETNYLNSSGDRFMEYNFDYVNEERIGAFTRYLGFSLNKRSLESDWAMIGNAVRLEYPIGSAQFVFDTAGSRRTVFRYAGGLRELLQIGFDGGPASPEVMQLGPSAMVNPEFQITRADKTAENATPVMVLIPGIGYRQILVGERDSCGVGKRCLEILN